MKFLKFLEILTIHEQKLQDFTFKFRTWNRFQPVLIFFCDFCCLDLAKVSFQKFKFFTSSLIDIRGLVGRVIFIKPFFVYLVCFAYYVRLNITFRTCQQTCSNQVLSNESSPESRPASEECCTHHNFIEPFNFSVNKRYHFRSSHELRLKIMWRPNKANHSRRSLSNTKILIKIAH